MAFEHFLDLFATQAGLADRSAILGQPAKYDHVLQSRVRARQWMDRFPDRLPADWRSCKVLDIGCGYGSLLAELGLAGAEICGIDINPRWIDLARANVADESKGRLHVADAQNPDLLETIARDGPFDLVILSDVLHLMIDVVPLFRTLQEVLRANGMIYVRVPNMRGLANVLADPVRGALGAVLVHPLDWPKITDKPPAGLVARRWEELAGVMAQLGFALDRVTPTIDETQEKTLAHVLRTTRQIRRAVREIECPQSQGKAILNKAYARFQEEVDVDVQRLAHEDLFGKYRTRSLEAFAHVSG
jgi:SAM-dependent methyltransferase